MNSYEERRRKLQLLKYHYMVLEKSFDKNKHGQHLKELQFSLGINIDICVFCGERFHAYDLKVFNEYFISMINTSQKFYTCKECITEFLEKNTPKNLIAEDEFVCVELLPRCTNCGHGITRDSGCSTVTCFCKTVNHVDVLWYSHAPFYDWLSLIRRRIETFIFLVIIFMFMDLAITRLKRGG
jgi:hypothetical protein